MKNVFMQLNKYQWLAIMGFVLFAFCWIVFGNGSNNNNNQKDYPLVVIDNEIRVKESGEVLYRFIPVDGGNMEFEYPEPFFLHNQQAELNYSCIKNIPSFIIGETPVTKRFWDYVMGDKFFLDGEEDFERYLLLYKDNVFAYGWYLFINKLEALTGRNFCLPSNYQWEYAARGGKYSKGYLYSGSDSIEKVAFYIDNSPTEVDLRIGKQKKANELGLYDMSGNVWELTTTPLTEIYPTMKILEKESADLSMGISRGGCWKSSAQQCQVKNVEHIVYFVSGARLLLKTNTEATPPIVYFPNKEIEDTVTENHVIAYSYGTQHLNLIMQDGKLRVFREQPE